MGSIESSHSGTRAATGRTRPAATHVVDGGYRACAAVPDVTQVLGLRVRAMLETFYSTAMRCSELMRWNILLGHEYIVTSPSRFALSQLAGANFVSFVAAFTMQAEFAL